MSDFHKRHEATDFGDLLSNDKSTEYSPGSAPGDPNFASLENAGTGTNLNEDPDVGALNDPSGADYREGDVGTFRYPSVGGADAYPGDGETVSGDVAREIDTAGSDPNDAGHKQPDELGRLDPSFDPMSNDDR